MLHVINSISDDYQQWTWSANAPKLILKTHAVIRLLDLSGWWIGYFADEFPFAFWLIFVFFFFNRLFCCSLNGEERYIQILTFMEQL